jgi:selT/selW/selH-like putative selenoprotein
MSKVVVEYDPKDVDQFIALADALEAEFPRLVVDGNPSGTGRNSAFEIFTETGAEVHSKLTSNTFPLNAEIISKLRSLDAVSGAPLK